MLGLGGGGGVLPVARAHPFQTFRSLLGRRRDENGGGRGNPPLGGEPRAYRGVLSAARSGGVDEGGRVRELGVIRASRGVGAVGRGATRGAALWGRGGAV